LVPVNTITFVTELSTAVNAGSDEVDSCS
jgi:hypothetical protein